MRLTALLFGKQAPMRRLFSGKRRLPIKVGMRIRRSVLADLAVEEENMFYLRQPFLTPEQEKGHMGARDKRKAVVMNMNAEGRKERMLKHVSYDARLDYLNCNIAWE